MCPNADLGVTHYKDTVTDPGNVCANWAITVKSVINVLLCLDASMGTATQVLNAFVMMDGTGYFAPNVSDVFCKLL